MKSIRIIWKKKNPKDKKGYLRLTTRVGNKTITRNLQLDPIEKKYFNTRTESVSKSFPNHEYYNSVIEKSLKEVERKGNKFLIINDEKRSFIEFMDILIERTSTPGTKLKYKSNRNMLVKFNSEVYNDFDIKFSDINVDFIEKYRQWLSQVRKNNSSSISNKIKHFKSYVKKGVNERHYYYDVNPFSLITNKVYETSVEVLDKEDLEKLMKTKLIEVYRGKINFGKIITDERVLNDPRYIHNYSLNDVRRFFFFQLFSQGLRVSDMMTLRWNDLYISKSKDKGVLTIQIRMKKRMVKTREIIDILINYNTIDLLRPYIPVDLLDDETQKIYSDVIQKKLEYQNNKNGGIINDKTKQLIVLDDRRVRETGLTFDNEGGYYSVSIDEVNKFISKYNRKVKRIVEVIDVTEQVYEYSEHVKNNMTLQYLNQIKNVLEKRKNDTMNVVDLNKDKDLVSLYQTMSDIIGFLSSDPKTKKMFCFPILKNEHFEDINEKNDFSTMSEKQYTRFTGGRSYYNRLLKVLQQQCGIKKTLTSHLSRHSYTSLMLQIGENIDLFDLMTSLGHKHLNTTQTYIQKFINPKIDVMNKQLSDYLNNKK
jgi:integrase